MYASYHSQSRVGKTYELYGKEYTHEAMRLGIERALRRAGVGRNSLCTCESGRKYKNCCRPAVYDNNTDLKELMIKMNLTSTDKYKVKVPC